MSYNQIVFIEPISAVKFEIYSTKLLSHAKTFIKLLHAVANSIKYFIHSAVQEIGRWVYLVISGVLYRN